MRGLEKVLRILPKAPAIVWADGIGKLEEATAPAVVEFDAGERVHCACGRRCQVVSDDDDDDSVCIRK